MALDPLTKALLDLTFPPAVLPEPAIARVAAVFARCWPVSSWASELADIELGETLTDMADRLEARWSPRWLVDAGFAAFDPGGHQVTLASPAGASGQLRWSPELRLPRVDDQIGDDQRDRREYVPYRRRLAGEVALAALWLDAASVTGVAPTAIESGLSGGKRGAQFRDIIAHILRETLGTGWTVASERPLASVFGLHLRRDVGGRETDVVVIHGNRLITMLSSKWTWRSDRGTEGAQIARLRKYRPDIPYVSVTSEFPRASRVARESDEDQVYFLAPQWIGSWLAVNQAISDGSNPRDDFPSLQDLKTEGTSIASLLGLRSMDDLLADLGAPTIY